ATAAGRALLAWLDKPRLNDYFTNLNPVALTDRTLTSKTKLKQVLMEVRRQGYAAIQSELDYGVVSVAVPVFSEDGRVVASLSCSTSLARQSMESMIEEVMPLLQQAARGIEVELRRSPLLVHSIIN